MSFVQEWGQALFNGPLSTTRLNRTRSSIAGTLARPVANPRAPSNPQQGCTWVQLPSATKHLCKEGGSCMAMDRLQKPLNVRAGPKHAGCSCACLPTFTGGMHHPDGGTPKLRVAAPGPALHAQLLWALTLLVHPHTCTIPARARILHMHAPANIPLQASSVPPNVPACVSTRKHTPKGIHALDQYVAGACVHAL
eukprot:1159483-Pelagomonas_calceolata.AAC.25